MSREYKLAWLAYFLSAAGDWISRLAVPIILFHLTGSAISLSLAYGITYLPFLVVTPIGGVVADVVDRRSLLVLGDCAAGLLVVLMALVAIELPGMPWLLYPLLFSIFSIVAVYHPIFQSYVPSLVPEKELAKGNSYITAGDNLTGIIGPLLGGVAIASIGAVNALCLDAASFLLSALCIYFVERRPLVMSMRRIATFEAWRADMHDGIAYVLKHPVLRYGCMLFAFTNLGLAIFTSNIMFFLLARLGLDSIGAGTVLGLAGCGGILGSLAAPLLGRHASAGSLILIATVVSGLGILSLIWLRDPLMVGSAWGVVLACNSVVVVTFFTLRQRVIPSEFLGRAVAITRVVSYLAVPLGSVLGGWLVERYGHVELAMVLSGAVVMASGFAGILTPINAQAPSLRGVVMTNAQEGRRP